jgi:hypothetical protein
MNQQLVNNNYLHVPGFITAQEADNLAQEFFIAQRDGKLALDPQCPSSPAAYNLFPCVCLLVKKTSQVSKLCDEDVLPTYTYGRIYTPGEVLGRHRDRDACEVSLTLNLSQAGKSWPIWIQKPNGEEVSLTLNPGDAMMYFGCIADHWREKFEGESHVQLFLHYVLANGPRAYAFFDRERRQ